MQLAVSGADTLATAKRLRSEDLGPENTLAGALNRIGRVVLGRLDYGVGLSSDVYMKAYDFIRRHHPALMTKLAPVFEFIDRVRNTGGSLRHRFESKGVAAFQLLGSLLNDIATATLPVQVGPAFAMAGHSGGSGSGGGSIPVASSGGGLGGAGGSTGSGSGGGAGTGGSAGSGIGQNNPPGGQRRPYNPDPYVHDPKNPSLLAEHEAQYSKTGGDGHLIDKHVGKTVQQLIDRFSSDPNITGSSSFPDTRTAERAVSIALSVKWRKVRNIQRGIQRASTVAVDVGFPVGVVVDPVTHQPQTTNWIVLSLRAKHSMPDGYYVLTAFPTRQP